VSWPAQEVTGIGLADRHRWNHNIEYFPVVLDALPTGARRVLDVGCGEGILCRRLAATVPTVVGLDVDPASLEAARRQGGGPTYVLGDLLAPPFEPESFDLVAAVTALHHMGTARGLLAMRDLVRPGGTVAAVGVARPRFPTDLPREVAAAVGTRAYQLANWGCGRRLWGTPAPTVWPPDEDFPQTRQEIERTLPGARFRRRLLWRWSATWTKPA
jgi:SAM-dependent methyltransferase